MKYIWFAYVPYLVSIFLSSSLYYLLIFVLYTHFFEIVSPPVNFERIRRSKIQVKIWISSGFLFTQFMTDSWNSTSGRIVLISVFYLLNTIDSSCSCLTRTRLVDLKLVMFGYEFFTIIFDFMFTCTIKYVCKYFKRYARFYLHGFCIWSQIHPNSILLYPLSKIFYWLILGLFLALKLDWASFFYLSNYGLIWFGQH